MQEEPKMLPMRPTSAKKKAILGPPKHTELTLARLVSSIKITGYSCVFIKLVTLTILQLVFANHTP